ncbi:MAG TPA: hypothetical protein VMJ10_10450 [Kofleriaceae bacterium]|nr:hypothetical protein [Kofleriaceae bacterium]
MPVIARDAVASDHLVYAWPFPIGPDEYEVACAEDEQVVMCPAWVVGERLGPGRHRWRTPDPQRPTSAFFVLTAPVEVSFDMVTQFVVPATGQPVRLRASGSLQVRCADPGLLIAQFVGLPFDHVNDGVLRSVSRSVERMLARLLTRRVVMANTPAAVTDPAMQGGIIEELVAYNPAAGAVFGVEMMRMGHLVIYADDGSQPWPADFANRAGSNGDTARSKPNQLRETMRAASPPMEAPPIPRAGNPILAVSGEIGGSRQALDPHRVIMSPVPDHPSSSLDLQTEEITQPGIEVARATTPPPGSLRTKTPSPAPPNEPRGAILGIGTSAIGHSSGASIASGEIPTKMAPGQRVLVPGPNGLMQSATIRQLLQGYYELEVGSSGETIWVPINNVVPE